MKRREFIRDSALAAGLISLQPGKLFAKSALTEYFGVHPFIEAHPNAVFILKTNIDSKTNSSAMLQAAKEFGNSVFIPLTLESGGIPTTYKIALRPNLTDRTDSSVSSQGVQSDVNFVEGIINSIVDLGVQTNQMYIREANSENLINNSLFDEMATRTGINLKITSSNYSKMSPSDLNWVTVTDGEFFNRIPYLFPYGTTDSYLINLAKLKSHWVGITGCSKNLQGSIAKDYVRHCTPIGLGFYNAIATDLKSGGKQTIVNNYKSRRDSGFPRYQKIYANDAEAMNDWEGPIRVESWMPRCFDNNKTLKAGLHILEGIYSREGAIVAEQPADFKELLTNIILFGKNQFAIDVVATYFAGHEPGNFAFFHNVFQKGLAPLNPAEVNIFEWSLQGDAIEKKISDYERFQLRTEYLAKPDESIWHMVNEPFDYTNYVFQNTSVQNIDKPAIKMLQPNYPNPFKERTSIKLELPTDGHIRLDISDIQGRVIDVIKEGFVHKGSYMFTWNTGNQPSGIYLCRLRFDQYSDLVRMQLIR